MNYAWVATGGRIFRLLTTAPATECVTIKCGMAYVSVARCGARIMQADIVDVIGIVGFGGVAADHAGRLPRVGKVMIAAWCEVDQVFQKVKVLVLDMSPNEHT